LTPATKENISLDDLIHTWMTRLSGECLFVSALEKTGYDTLRQVLYNKVRELHVQKYPYDDFLFEHYEEQE
jgi:GTP-binding protein HflX